MVVRLLMPANNASFYDILFVSYSVNVCVANGSNNSSNGIMRKLSKST